MKPINFLESPPPTKITRKYWLIILVAFLGLCCGLAYLHIRAAHNLQKQKQKYMHSLKKRNEVQAIENEIARVIHNRNQMTKDIAKIEQKTQKRRLILDILYHLADVVPNEITLEKIEMERHTIIITGQAPINQRESIQHLASSCLETTWCKHAAFDITSENNELLFTITLTSDHKDIHGNYQTTAAA